MQAEELAKVLAVCLRDELVAKVSRKGNVLTVVFVNGTVRTVTVA